MPQSRNSFTFTIYKSVIVIGLFKVEWVKNILMTHNSGLAPVYINVFKSGN